MKRITLHDKTFTISIPYEEIDKKIAILASQIEADYIDKKCPVFISILNGSFMFAAEIMKKLECECELSFVKLASYSDTDSCGKVSQLIGLSCDLRGRDIIVLEDIIETGGTIAAINKLLEAQSPASIRYATLFFKPECYKENIKVDYRTFTIKNDFIVGFGLDYNQLGRNYKDIYTIEQ